LKRSLKGEVSIYPRWHHPKRFKQSLGQFSVEPKTKGNNGRNPGLIRRLDLETGPKSIFLRAKPKIWRMRSEAQKTGRD
jgi:hypothetical protein